MAIFTRIVELPRKHLIGMKVATDMQKTSDDCPALWKTFVPRMHELPKASHSYGVSVMTGAKTLDYWAAVEALPATAIPSGMQTFDLPAGLYVAATTNLAEIASVYDELYGSWAQSQTDYSINRQAPSFEFYPNDWQPEIVFEIFAPLTRK
jgi:predicted transcriptional regulator YdeE